MSILNIGVSGLNAAQAGIATTSHNISNVNTPGYSRQQTVQSTNTPQFSGIGYVGQGVDINTVRRQYDSFLTTQARTAQSASSQLSTQSSMLQNIDNLLADNQMGLTPVMNDFFSAVSTLASNPSDPAARQAMISAGQTLSTRFSSLSGQLSSMRDQTNATISQSVSTINSLTDQIAKLNNSIAAASGNANAPPNDLLDQRDSLLRDLSKEISVSVVPANDGSLSVFMNNGQALVLGGQQTKLQAQADPGDPENTAVGMMVGGQFKPYSDSSIGGGKLGGALAFRQSLDGAANGLGRLAISLGQGFNAQHDVGQDLNGNLGTDFFSVGTPLALTNANNSGNAQIGASISNVGALTTSDYKLGFDGTNYTVTRLSDKTQQVFPSLPQTVDGVTIGVTSGSMAAGDSFIIQPTRSGASSIDTLVTDPARVAAALPVRASIANANTGTGTMNVTGVTPPANANLRQAVSIVFTSPTTFNVVGTGTGNPTGLTYTPGMQISYNGWNATLSGTPANGDTFNVGTNSNASGDNGNANALAGLQLAKLMGGGTASINDAYSQMVGDIGSQTHAAQIGAAAQATVLTNADSAQQGVSGVNLDEEAANLLKYQQAYQAASKVISTANSLFDSILSIMK
ncbi:MAG: flagellar hook-associated protein FlgK [Betaproteobacteria bacterium]|nr:flagellar hook-associated protein FlgK [Betaproteobacteria bacterium]